MSEISNTVLKIKDLQIGYSKKKKLLENNLDFNIESKQIWGIVGPNGSGKTTLIKTILGLLKPINGSVDKLSGMRIGYVPQRGQNDSIFPVSALDVVLMGCSAVTGAFRKLKKSDMDFALHLLQRVGLQKFIHQPYRSLSGGQKQRVIIARALAVSPKLLILDEPTDGMDLSGEADLFSLINDIRHENDLAVLIITHALHLAAAHTEYMILFHGENNKAEIGKTSLLLEPVNLSAIYKRKVEVKNINGTNLIYLPIEDKN